MYYMVGQLFACKNVLCPQDGILQVQDEHPVVLSCPKVWIMLGIVSGTFGEFFRDHAEEYVGPNLSC